MDDMLNYITEKVRKEIDPYGPPVFVEAARDMHDGEVGQVNTYETYLNSGGH